MVFSFLVGCSASKEKSINGDELKSKIIGKVTSPGLGEETEVQSYRQANKGMCKYLQTQSKQVQYADSTKIEVAFITKYDLLTSGSACPAFLLNQSWNQLLCKY